MICVSFQMDDHMESSNGIEMTEKTSGNQTCCESFNPYRAEIFCINYGDRRFFLI